MHIATPLRMSSSLSCTFVPDITARRTGDLAVDDGGLRIAVMPTAVLALLWPLRDLTNFVGIAVLASTVTTLVSNSNAEVSALRTKSCIADNSARVIMSIFNIKVFKKQKTEILTSTFMQIYYS